MLFRTTKKSQHILTLESVYHLWYTLCMGNLRYYPSWNLGGSLAALLLYSVPLVLADMPASAL